MFNKFKNKKNEKEKGLKENEKKELELEKENEKENEELELEKWVWVEGYKGIHEDMTAYGGFKYELNKSYIAKGEISSCIAFDNVNGFHFSLNIDDVFGYYKLIDNNRFFKVKGLVRQSELNEYNNKSVFIIPIDKLVAKEIIIKEEITDEELFKLSKNFLNTVYPSKEVTLEDFKIIKKIGIVKFKHNEFKKMFDELGLSDLLIEIIISENSDEQLRKLYKLGKALRMENISNDLFIYYLLKE